MEGGREKSAERTLSVLFDEAREETHALRQRTRHEAMAASPRAMFLMVTFAAAQASYFIANSANKVVLVLWVILLAGFAVYRTACLRVALRSENLQSIPENIVRALKVSSLGMALFYGLGMLLLLQAAHTSEWVIIITGVIGVAAGSIIRISYFPELAMPFVVLVVAPLLLALIIMVTPESLLLAGLICVFLLYLVFASKSQVVWLRQFSQLRAREAQMSRLLAEAGRKVDEAFNIEASSHKSQEEGPSIEQDDLQEMLYRIRPDGAFVSVSSSVEPILGYKPEELVGRSISEFVPSEEAAGQLRQAILECEGKLRSYRHQIVHADGSIMWLSANTTMKKGYIVGSSRDVTELVVAEQQLQQANERAKATLDGIDHAVITTSQDGRVDFFNPAARRMTGYTVHELLDKPIDSVIHLISTQTRKEIMISELSTSSGTIRLERNVALVDARGQERRVQVQLSKLGEDAGLLLVMHDISRIEELTQQLHFQASHDGLTGLMNRITFEEVVVRLAEDARKNDVTHALLFLDLDQFKIVNDTCGHNAGDELLRQLTDRLRQNLRDSAVLARLGGDEFGVVLEQNTLVQASKIGKRLCEVVKDYRFIWGDQSFECGVSIGAIEIHRDSGTLPEILSTADAACYLAKDQGRNRVYAVEGEDDSIRERKGEIRWMQVLQQALAGDHFELYIQPIFALDKNVKSVDKPVSVEFLLRLRDESGNMIQPLAFLPAAERYHLMPQVDRWVVKQAIGHIELQLPKLRGVQTFCVNLSGQSLGDETFLDFVIQRLDESQVDPNCLCFEITETAVVSNLVRAKRFISVLRGMGCKFSLDDFGSGLSSFRYLKDLEVDLIKIDGAFIRDIATDNLDRAMVVAINSIGQMMNIQTVAEYVDAEPVFEAVRKLEIDYAQGNYLAAAQPLSVEED